MSYCGPAVATGQGASTVCDYAGHMAALAACVQVDHIYTIGIQLMRVALDERSCTP
jgi:hypothetical protein